MLNCRQVTRLVSQSMDAKLRWYQRLGMRIHLLYCVWCRRYAAQLRFLRRASHHLGEEQADAVPQRLPPEAKQRIRERIQESMRDAHQE